MPLVSRIVEVDGYKLLDGGIADSIPLAHFESLGYTKNVVILTQPADYIKQKNNMMPLVRCMLRKYPAMVQAMENRHIHYNETLAYIRTQEDAGKAFVIRPEEKLPVGHIEHKADKLKVVYDIGRKTGLTHLPAMKEFLQVK